LNFLKLRNLLKNRDFAKPAKPAKPTKIVILVRAFANYDKNHDFTYISGVSKSGFNINFWDLPIKAY